MSQILTCRTCGKRREVDLTSWETEIDGDPNDVPCFDCLKKAEKASNDAMKAVHAMLLKQDDIKKSFNK